jgi:hypothetical protein
LWPLKTAERSEAKPCPRIWNEAGSASGIRPAPKESCAHRPRRARRPSAGGTSWGSALKPFNEGERVRVQRRTVRAPERVDGIRDPCKMCLDLARSVYRHHGTIRGGPDDQCLSQQRLTATARWAN